MFTLPEHCKIVMGRSPIVGAAAAFVGDYVSLKNVLRAWLIIKYNQADGNAITWHVNRATAVAPTAAAVLATAVPIWSNLACAATDTLVRRTDAVNYATDAAATEKMVVFEIDPAKLGRVGAVATGAVYDCVAAASTTAIAAAQYVDYTYILEMRYAQATPPATITD